MIVELHNQHMIINDIRINAQYIFQLLLSKGSLSMREIAEITNYQEPVLSMTIGWMACENKIRIFENNNILNIELICPTSDFYY